MRLLCDANVGTTIAKALIAAGHDTAQATIIAPHAGDRTILSLAVDQDRVLITCDRDFGELVFFHHAPPPPAIIYIRFQPADVSEIIPRLLAVLDLRTLQDHMTVIGSERERRTPFPVKSDPNG